MKKLVRGSLLLSLGISLSNCGETSVKGKSDRELGPSRIVSEGYDQEYLIEDASCQSGDGASNLEKFEIPVWQNGSLKKEKLIAGSIGSQDSLTGELISKTEYALHQRTECKLIDGALSCGDSSELVESPKSLRLCRPKGPYQRTSVEGIALISLNNLEIAHSFYRSLENNLPSLQKTSLLVLPKVERTYKKLELDGTSSTKVKAVTDNLAYAPNFNGAPSFVIFPKGSKEARKGLWENLNLWESTWALAHEYGHHVMRSHSGVKDIESRLTNGFFPPIMPESNDDADVERNSGEYSLASRSVSVNDIWGSVNEGYADMFAYYALGGQKGIPDRISCFEKNRDVAESRFKSGDEKVLSKKVTEIFFSTETQSGSSNCDVPSFQDIHAIGAIIAYGMDQLYSLNGNAARTPAEKAVMLIKWAERLNKLVDRVGGDKITLDQMILEGVLVAAQGTKLSGIQCASIKKNFPAFADSWQKQSLTCER